MFLRTNQRDRWLLSYADFITLLFAMFVLMYASAKAHAQRTPAPQGAAAASVTARSNLLTDLIQNLKLEREHGALTVSTEQRGIVIALDDRMCFQPGQAEIEPSAMPVFEKVGGILGRYNSRILLEGHTDSTPIHNDRFRSNWELSTARSIAVMELLEQRAGIRQERFLIGGSAANAPVSNNDTEQARAHNRRVEIIVLDDTGTPSQIGTEHPVSFAQAVQ